MPTLNWSKRDSGTHAASRVPYRLLEEVCGLDAGSWFLRASSHIAALPVYAILAFKHIMADAPMASVPMKDCAR